MPTVEKNIIKEWFRNLKKPDQDQFWAWLDSFYHKLEGIAIEGITGLQDALNKKADLVNGVVPENQLPFTINTNEVIAIGAIAVTTNNVHIAVHESGSNKVRINGQILERSFPDNLPFTPVTEGNKFLRIVARNQPGLFFLKQSVESDEPQEPSLDAGEVHVRLILVTPDGSYIDPQLLNGFKTKAEDTWKTVFPNKLGNFVLPYNDERTCFSLETAIPSATQKTLQIIQFGTETTRDVSFTIKNNTLGSVVIPALITDGLSKGFVDNTPFVIQSLGTVFVKYNHVRNVVEILKVGSSDSITSVSTDSTLKGTGTVADPVGLSVAKNSEIAAKLDKTATAAQNVASDVTFAGKVNATSYYFVSDTSIGTAGKLQYDGSFWYGTNALGQKRQFLQVGTTYEHQIKGKRVDATISGTFVIDLSAGSHFTLNATAATTVSFTNMIATDETCAITMTVTGSLISLPSWLVRDNYSDVPDVLKTREYNIVIKRGGSTPSGRYTVSNNT